MLERNKNLQDHNTLRLASRAEAYVRVDDLPALHAALQHCQQAGFRPLPLGDGSNIVLQERIPGCVLDIQLKGMTLLREDESHVWVEVGAGENWHQWVMQSIAHGWYGLENLALIPGRVGAAPIQNIGAYGCEVNRWIETVNYVELDADHSAALQHKKLSNEQCEFRYRDSIFKGALANRFIITSVIFRLSKIFTAILNYPALREAVIDHEPTHGEPKAIALDALDIAQAVITIRQSKLPDPAELPNAGSFFKNIEANQEQLDQLLGEYPDAPYFVAANTTLSNGKATKAASQYRIPSAWLIDQCGLKGFRHKAIGLHTQQALVLVNYGASERDRESSIEDSTDTKNETVCASDVMDFAALIAARVKNKFGFDLQIEPQLIP